jgi:hypothetical protein
MKTLAEFLRAKHFEYCQQKNRMVSEGEWVNEVLNRKLPAGDKLSSGTVNLWMTDNRMPDARNIARLYRAFGAEVLPYIGLEIPGDLLRLMRDWDHLPSQAQAQIKDIIQSNRNGEPAASAA